MKRVVKGATEQVIHVTEVTIDKYYISNINNRWGFILKGLSWDDKPCFYQTVEEEFTTGNGFVLDGTIKSLESYIERVFNTGYEVYEFETLKEACLFLTEKLG